MPKKKVSAIDYIKMYKEVFGTPDGKIVLMDICNRCHIMATTKKNTDKVGDIEFREGQRNVALFLLKQVNYDLEKLFEERANNQLEVNYNE